MLFNNNSTNPHSLSITHFQAAPVLIDNHYLGPMCVYWQLSLTQSVFIGIHCSGPIIAYWQLGLLLLVPVVFIQFNNVPTLW